MRRRGGQAADIAILIVAADDSVMPQTRESIEHIKPPIFLCRRR